MKPIVFFSYLLTPIVRAFTFPKIRGRENYPDTDGPLILCANHFSNCDVLVLSTTIQKPFRYIAKKSLFENPITGGIMRWFQAIPVDRDSRDVAALRSAIRAAKEGQPVVIFPQGTRVRDREPNSDQAKKGVALMIASTGATVLPVGLYTKGYRFRLFRRYHVNIGRPITSEMYRAVLEDGDKETRFERLTEYVFGEVCKLAKPIE